MISGYLGRAVMVFAATFVFGLSIFHAALAQDGGTPKRGGELKFVVGSKIPSFDGHRETTWGMLQPIRPFYSLLIRVNPDNPQNVTDYVCDLCTDWSVSPDGKIYVFNIRRDVDFHNGQHLTAHDMVATYDKIVFPPDGVKSIRRASYSMIDRLYADGDYKFVVELKHPSAGFLPAMANPFNFVYSKADLEQYGYEWHQENINGTGAFRFTGHEAGDFVRGERYAKYHHKDGAGQPLPYLDGFKAISERKLADRLESIRDGDADIEFRGYPPFLIEYMQEGLGDDFAIQVSDWNCVMGYHANQGPEGPAAFKDVRVRQALSLALDRWSGSDELVNDALVKTVGGVIFPGHPLAATKRELTDIPGFGGDPVDSKARARQLLRDAGAEGMSFRLWNRAVNQPYKVVGKWMVDQWRDAGFDVSQDINPTGPWYRKLKIEKDHEAAIDLNCQPVVNPLHDVSKWQSADIAGNNYAGYIDRTLDDWYRQMNQTADKTKIRSLMRQFERRLLWDEARWGSLFWWNRILMYRSYVKGYNIAPSHYLNQHLDRVWLDK